MSDLVLGLDVGGTNTRLRVADLAQDGRAAVARADVTARVNSASELCDFVSRIVSEVRRDGWLSSAVVAVAGPVACESVRITNWPSDSLVTVSELELAGLPTGHTYLVNDVVAGAWGALARIDSDVAATLPPSLTASYGGDHLIGAGNLVYVAPGTGLGSAAIVRHGMGPLRASAIASEAQHTQMPRFEGMVGQVVDVLNTAIGHAPSWEDVVSGRGLVRTYDALHAIATATPLVLGDDASRAEGIAQAAQAGTDTIALAAVDVFYRTLGRFVQTLALTLLPCAAVVIGGASTERNSPLLDRAGLAETFVDHDRFGEMLARIPLFTIGEDVNLEGGVWLAAQDHAPQRAGTGPPRGIS